MICPTMAVDEVGKKALSNGTFLLWRVLISCTADLNISIENLLTINCNYTISIVAHSSRNLIYCIWILLSFAWSYSVKRYVDQLLTQLFEKCILSSSAYIRVIRIISLLLNARIKLRGSASKINNSKIIND